MQKQVARRMKLTDPHKFDVSVGLCLLYAVNHVNHGACDASRGHVHGIVGSIQLDLLQRLFSHGVLGTKRRQILISQHTFSPLINCKAAASSTVLFFSESSNHILLPLRPLNRQTGKVLSL